MLETVEHHFDNRSSFAASSNLRFGSGLSWQNYLRAFTECPKCDRIILQDSRVRKDHACDPSGSVAAVDVLSQLDSELCGYPGITKEQFRELLVRCSSCNHVWMRKKFTSHVCPESVRIVPQ